MITVKSPFGIYTCHDGERIINQIQKYGAHTRPELSMVLSFIKPGDTVLDVGAHIGTFAIPIIKKIGPEGTLLAFEANSDTVELLKKNLSDNNPEAEIFNKGVSHKSGNLYLRDRTNKDSSSLSDYLVESSSQNNKNFVKVELVKVDDIISQPVNLIKIDVEGMELSVLQSAEKTIDNYRPLIYTEYVEYYIKRAGLDLKSFEEFFKKRNYHFFINAGTRNASNDEFTLVKVPGPKYTRGQVDFLMIPQDSNGYPTDYKNWMFCNPFKFLCNRARNILKILKAKF